MKSIYDRVKEYFERQDVPCYEDRDRGTIQVVVTSHHGTWPCAAQVDDERHLFSFYSILPVRIRRNKRTNVAEYLTRVNHGLLLGNFELDFDDGEVRYRSSVPIYGELSDAALDHIVRTNVNTVDRYLEGMMAVAFSDCSPEESFVRAQRGDVEPVFDFESCR